MDPHIRYPHDPAPVVPGAKPEAAVERTRPVYISREEILRFSWPDRYDPDVQRIRTEVAEGGKGLYIMRMGGTGVKAVVEAYYPEDIREKYFLKNLNRFQKTDYCMGRLVAVNVLFQYVGEIHPAHILEIRRNHRNARADLKRSHDFESYVAALHEEEERRIAPALGRWSDFYTDAYSETVKAHKPKNTEKRR
jgi:hypothetical protein